MKRWQIVVIAIAAASCVGLIAWSKPYVEARLSWYYLGDRLSGRNLLLTCLSEDPILKYGGTSHEARFDKLVLAKLEVFLACRTAGAYKDRLVAQTRVFDKANTTVHDLVSQQSWCGHPGFSDEQVGLCRDTTFEAIDWMIESGAALNPNNSCGYLHRAVQQMNEEMFNFLLSRGADPAQRCPPDSIAFGDGVDSLIDTNSKTVSQQLTVLLSEYSDNEKNTLVSGWVRMLETIEGIDN